MLALKFYNLYQFKDPEDDIEVMEDDSEAESELEEPTTTIGEVISVKDGVAFVSGLPNIQVGEMVAFTDKNITGMALNLEEDRVGCIIFGDDTAVQQDDSVEALNTLVKTPVGYNLLGRVVDGIGNVIDGGEVLHFEEYLNVERKALEL